jgi:hypothetical protein
MPDFKVSQILEAVMRLRLRWLLRKASRMERKATLREMKREG